MTMLEEDGGGSHRRTVAEIWGSDSIQLGYSAIAARLRGDEIDMDLLVGPEGVSGQVGELLDGLIAAATVLAFDRPETAAYRHHSASSHKMLAHLFSRWRAVEAGVEPTEGWWFFHGGQAAFEREALGNCLHCGCLTPMDDDGLIRPHRWGLAGPPTDRPRRCPGSGLRPHDVLSPRQHLAYRTGDYE